MRTRTIVLVACGLMGCAREPSAPPLRSLAGNYAALLRDGGAFTASLQVAHDQIVGTAFAGATDALRAGAVVVGTTRGDSVLLTVTPVQPGDVWQFLGVRRGDTLSGEFARTPGRGFLTSLVRVDTVASGRASLTIGSSPAVAVTGGAYFIANPLTSRLTVLIESLDSRRLQVLVEWPRLAVPAPGRYAVALVEGAEPRAIVIEAPDVVYDVTGGTVTVAVANRFGVLGSLELTLRARGSAATTRLTGRFSAGCGSLHC